ncbi:MAG TPA: head-tail connector protein [Stellaceae bacterium]|nr:head-tail connector protein [Stellaceae bacterium]
MSFGDLCTLADVKAWLNTGGPSAPFPSLEDALLARLITAASQAIQSWLGRPILAADWTETRDGLAGAYGAQESRFPFGVTPCSAVALVVVDGVAVPPVPNTAPARSYAAQAGYVFSPTQLVVRGYCVPRKAQCVLMQYTAGYASVPPDIAQAAIEVVALRYRARTRIGEVSKRIGSEVVSYDRSDIPAAVKAMLQPYRLVAPIAGLAPQPAPTATDPAILVGAG